MSGRNSHSSVSFSAFGSTLMKMGGGKDPASGQKPQRLYAMPGNTRHWLGARLPFCAFCGILSTFTYAYHIVPLLPWLLTLLCLNFAVLATWPPQSQIGGKSRTVWDWAPLGSWLLALSCAVLIGLENYSVIEAWINTTFLREYNDVALSTDPRAMNDAGILNFAAGTSLATAKSAGYKHFWEHFCAAPLVRSGEDAAAQPVSFWAVGTDCCESRGKFTCGSAGDKSARSGLPVRPLKHGNERADGFKKAIRMAAAAHGLEVGKETMYVMWAKDPKHIGKKAWWTATTVFFFVVVAALLTCCACQSGLQHISDLELH